MSIKEMAKRLLFISFLSLILFSCYSQKSSLTLSVGPSFPVGAYAGKNLDNEHAGFAGIGEQVNISFDYKPGKYFGFSATLYGQRNGLNAKAMERDLSQRRYSIGFFTWYPGAPPPTTVTYVTYPNWKINKSAWMMGSALVGVSAELPCNKSGNLSFVAKIMAGVVYVSSPKLFGKSVTDTAQAQIEQTSESALGISYLTRAGLKYHLNKKWILVAGVDYFSTGRLTFDDVKATLTSAKTTGGLPQSSQSMQTGDARQTISTINLNVGVGLRL
jgi:hypothetical protein